MKYIKALTCLVTILAVAGWAGAAPFLVCDPDPNCQTYNIYANDVLIQEDVSPPLNYDLKDMAPGIINFDVECCNYWGCEKTVDPYVSLDAPGAPPNTRMEP